MIRRAPCSEPNAWARHDLFFATASGRAADQRSRSVRGDQYSSVNHDYSRYHLTHPRTQPDEQAGSARHRLGRRASCQPLPLAVLATTAATATAAISSSMTCFTSGPNGALSVASLIRVL